MILYSLLGFFLTKSLIQLSKLMVYSMRSFKKLNRIFNGLSKIKLMVCFTQQNINWFKLF